MSISTDKLESRVHVGKNTATGKHVRGSSLLLVGRVLSMCINFAVQVLTVRALSKSDYGAFAYALSVVSFGTSVAVFGLDKTITRFVPIYEEQKDYDRVFGTIIMMVGAIVSIGIALILIIFGFQELLVTSFIKDQDVVALILVMIALAPLQALQSLAGGMLAIFAGPRAIFFRRYILGPGLKLAVILLVMLVHGNVYLMANGYLVAGILGLAVYVVIIWRTFIEKGLLTHFNLRSIKLPLREVFGFSIPLLSTDLVFLLRNFLVIAVLQYFYSTSDVASFRAVLPVAGLNMLVYESFTFLYMPTASRMFARKEWSGINDLYWQSAAWIAIASFPIFVLTFSFAQPITLLFFGERYSESGVILALLALGHYVNAALGFNAFTLRVYGKVRNIFFIDLVAVVISIGTSLILIPLYGVLGAAIAVTSTMIAHNFLNQAGLAWTTDIQPFHWQYLKTYLSIVAGGLFLLAIESFVAPPIYVDVVLTAVVSCMLVYINRSTLNVAQTFPELLRLPFMRHLLSKPKPHVTVVEKS